MTERKKQKKQKTLNLKPRLMDLETLTQPITLNPGKRAKDYQKERQHNMLDWIHV
jgi:hypothetical protein